MKLKKLRRLWMYIFSITRWFICENMASSEVGRHGAHCSLVSSCVFMHGVYDKTYLVSKLYY